MLMNTTFLEDSFLIKWQSRGITRILEVYVKKWKKIEDNNVMHLLGELYKFRNLYN